MGLLSSLKRAYKIKMPLCGLVSKFASLSLKSSMLVEIWKVEWFSWVAIWPRNLYIFLKFYSSHYSNCVICALVNGYRIWHNCVLPGINKIAIAEKDFLENVPTNVNNHIEMFTLTETQFQTSKYYPIFSQEVSCTMTECDVFAPCKWVP